MSSKNDQLVGKEQSEGGGLDARLDGESSGDSLRTEASYAQVVSSTPVIEVIKAPTSEAVNSLDSVVTDAASSSTTEVDNSPASRLAADAASSSATEAVNSPTTKLVTYAASSSASEASNSPTSRIVTDAASSVAPAAVNSPRLVTDAVNSLAAKAINKVTSGTEVTTVTNAPATEAEIISAAIDTEAQTTVAAKEPVTKATKALPNGPAKALTTEDSDTARAQATEAATETTTKDDNPRSKLSSLRLPEGERHSLLPEVGHETVQDGRVLLLDEEEEDGLKVTRPRRLRFPKCCPVDSVLHLGRKSRYP